MRCYMHVSASVDIVPRHRGTYIRAVCTFGALQWTANFCKKNEGVLIFGGVLIYGVLRYCINAYAQAEGRLG